MKFFNFLFQFFTVCVIISPMSIQSENSYGDIRSLIQDVGKKAILNQKQAIGNIKLATKDYRIEATFNPQTREVCYKMTSLSAHGAEGTSAKKTQEFTEKLGFFGGRNINEVEHKMVSELRSYSNMKDCLKNSVRHASNEETTKSVYVDGQKYRIKTSAKGKDDVVSITLMALDETGKAVLEKTFRCSNDRIDKTGKTLLEETSVRSNNGGKKTTTRFEQKAYTKVYTANLKNDMRTTRKTLDRYTKDLEEILNNLRNQSANIADAAEAITKCTGEISRTYPADEPRNKDVRAFITNISGLRDGINSKQITTADAATATLEKNINEFKAAALGRRISDLVGIINDPEVSKKEKLNAREKLAKIANDILKSDDLNFVRAMGGLSNNLMCLAVKHGIVELAKKGEGKKLMEDSRTMLDCFKNEGASLNDRTLAMTKLGILYGAGFYGENSLGKDIAKAAQKFLADLSFLGIAAMHGQGKDFAQELQTQLAARRLPTDGKLFVAQRPEGDHFDDHGEKRNATKVHTFIIEGLKVTVAEQMPVISAFPYICIIDSNDQPLYADIRAAEIVNNTETTPQTKLKQLVELESRLNQVSPELAKLGETCTDIAPPRIGDPGGQNYTRPPMVAAECRKHHQRIQKQLTDEASKTTTMA
jgi:hypothetical protein